VSSFARNVDVLKIFSDRLLVNVGAVYGVLWGPFDLRLFDAVAVEIQNPDGTQVIDCFVDVGTATGGPWSTSAWNGLAAIQPLTTRGDVFSKPAQTWIRFIAKADGAGVNNVIVSVSGIERKLISGGIT
jgi:hypothetical protein